MSLLSGATLAVLHLFLGQILQLVSGATLPAGFLICCLGVSFLLGTLLSQWFFFLQEASGTTLPVGFLICCLGVRNNIGFSCWVFDLLFGCQKEQWMFLLGFRFAVWMSDRFEACSFCWGAFFLISFLSGASLSVRFAGCVVWVSAILLRDVFLNASFIVWVPVLLMGIIFLTSLLSGVCLSVGFPVACLGF